MQHKNDYSVIVFFNNDKPKKWEYVHGLISFVNFLNQKHRGWKYLNVYERRTAKFLKRFYPNSAIPNFLNLSALTFFFFLTFSIATFGLSTFTNGFNNSATISTFWVMKEVRNASH